MRWTASTHQRGSRSTIRCAKRCASNSDVWEPMWRRSAPVVEFSRWWLEFGEWKCQEALLDLSVRWSGAWIPKRLLDITMRDPEADRYQPTAQHVPETTAERAHKEKDVRYLATHEAAVETIPLEPLGRVGKEGLMEIQAIAADAAKIRGDKSAAPNVVRRIRQAMEYTMVAWCGDRAGRSSWRKRNAIMGAGSKPQTGHAQPKSTNRKCCRRKRCNSGKCDAATPAAWMHVGRGGEKLF